MDLHVKLLGWLYIILGVLGVFAAACVGLVILGGGLISGDQTAITVTGITAVMLAGFLFVLSAPGILAGAGLLTRQTWGRVLALVLGILNLPGFPTGTALGIYTLYVLLDDDASQIFAGS